MNVGFVSFRFMGTDGVSLEAQKWVDVLEGFKWNCYYFCGEADTPEERTELHPEVHFNHPEIREITQECFSSQFRTPALTSAIHRKRRVIKNYFYDFISKFDIKFLIIENILSIPMNIPLSMAVVEVISETKIPTIIHHHDFYWERDRFLFNCVQDILQGNFPPNLPFVRHVTINTLAQSQLGSRCGIVSTVMPNIMNFEKEMREPDEYSKSLKKALNIAEDAICILQPTRIVQRKGIEHAIEISRRLGRKNVLVISHESGDEGDEYKQRILEFADMLNVELRLTSELVGNKRETKADGKKLYDLNDVYNMSDFVTYPSLIEGFGNAFLEAIYFKKVMVINRFPVYVADIKPKGFKCLEFSNFISNTLIKEINSVLERKEEIEEMVEHNFGLARAHYSSKNLHLQLQNIIVEFLGFRAHQL